MMAAQARNQAAGQVSRTPRRPSIMNTSQNGTNSDSNGNWRPVMAPILNCVDAGHLSATMIRNPQGTEGDRCGVGNQAQAGGIQRVEAKADQQGGGNCHEAHRSRRHLQEGAEAETDQHRRRWSSVIDSTELRMISN